jgi:hypothetical protein
MGDLNAVWAAQEAHLSVLDTAGLNQIGGNVGDSRFPRGPVSQQVWGFGHLEELLFGVVIDDLAAFVMVPWSHVHAPDNLGSLAVARADAQYLASGWPRAVNKDFNDESVADIWGQRVDGNAGTSGANWNVGWRWLDLLYSIYINHGVAVSYPLFWGTGLTSFKVAGRAMLYYATYFNHAV